MHVSPYIHTQRLPTQCIQKVKPKNAIKAKSVDHAHNLMHKNTGMDRDDKDRYDVCGGEHMTECIIAMHYVISSKSLIRTKPERILTRLPSFTTHFFYFYHNNEI